MTTVATHRHPSDFLRCASLPSGSCDAPQMPFQRTYKAITRPYTQAPAHRFPCALREHALCSTISLPQMQRTPLYGVQTRLSPSLSPLLSPECRWCHLEINAQIVQARRLLAMKLIIFSAFVMIHRCFDRREDGGEEWEAWARQGASAGKRVRAMTALRSVSAAAPSACLLWRYSSTRCGFDGCDHGCDHNRELRSYSMSNLRASAGAQSAYMRRTHQIARAGRRWSRRSMG